MILQFLYGIVAAICVAIVALFLVYGACYNLINKPPSREKYDFKEGWNDPDNWL